MINAPATNKAAPIVPPMVVDDDPVSDRGSVVTSGAASDSESTDTLGSAGGTGAVVAGAEETVVGAAAVGAGAGAAVGAGLACVPCGG